MRYKDSTFHVENVALNFNCIDLDQSLQPSAVAEQKVLGLSKTSLFLLSRVKEQHGLFFNHLTGSNTPL